MIHHGDCIEVMATLPEASIDAIVTDPPYGIGFMGKAWDGAAIEVAANRDRTERKSLGPHSETRPGRAASRSSSAFGGPSSQAGAYDFSLSGNRAYQAWTEEWALTAYCVAKPSAYLLAFGGTRTVHRMTCALEDAGWIIRDMLVWGYASGFPKSKASLKPAWEPIVMARKPGPLRMLAIDACRIPTDGRPHIVSKAEPSLNVYGDGLNGSSADGETTLGRWPANIVLTDPIFDGGIEGVVGGGVASYNPAGVFGQQRGDQPEDTAAPFAVRRDGDGIFGYGDTGTYSRFFLIPKAARSDREPVLGGTLPVKDANKWNAGGIGERRRQAGQSFRENSHPTVKPVDLMRHLVRLVTPTGGVVLDPFLGSGTTALAAEMEGFEWIGIERQAEYVAIAEARLNGTQRGLGLEVG